MHQIITTSLWEDIQKNFDSHVNNDTWVILDVDNTLIFADDIAFCCHEDYYKQQIKFIDEYECNQIPKLELEELGYQIRFSLPSFLMDKKIPDIIKSLQAKNITTFALTYMLSHTQSHDCTAWRYQQLKHLYIDFTPTSPLQERYEFKQIPSTYPIGHPTLSNGIFYSHHCPKGKCLEQLIQISSHRPKSIIFVDDALNNLKDVEASTQKLSIDFFGIEYKGYLNFNRQNPALDDSLLNRWNKFKKTGYWDRIPVTH